MTVTELKSDQPPADDPAGGLFCFSDNDEHFTQGDYKTRAEAFAAGCDFYADAPCIYVGEVIPMTHSMFIDGDTIVDAMCDAAAGEVSDAAGDYLEEIGSEEIKELETMLAEWFERKAGVVRFWRVENVERMPRDPEAQA